MGGGHGGCPICYTSSMQKKLTVAVVFGGRSGEYEVSIVSAQSVAASLDPKKYEVILIGITPEGSWLCDNDAGGATGITGGVATMIAARLGGAEIRREHSTIFEAFKKKSFKNLAPVQLSLDPGKKGFYVGAKHLPVDVVFPVLHGPYGEDGMIQGLCEMASLPYVGCGVTAASTCMDKLVTKRILQSLDIPQVPFLSVTRDDINKNFPRIKTDVLKQLGLPCFVKPANLGSSVGISKVKKIAELKGALELAAEFDYSIIIEKGISAREIECAVLGNHTPEVSIAGEIVPSREFYDFYAKYVDNSSELFIPAHITKKQIATMQKIALDAYLILQCSGLSRIDFLMDKRTGKFYLNELNTMPGFTSISMYPKLWAASGIPYKKLLDRLIALGMERYKERQATKTTFESGSDWFKK